MGVVGSFIAGFALLFAYTLRRWQHDKTDISAPALVLAFPFITLSFIALSLIWTRLRVLTWGGGAQAASTDTRAEQWANFWPAIAEWPFGYGIAQGAQHAGTMNGEGVFTLDSHYIFTFLNYGLLGGAAFYLIFILAGISAFKAGVSNYGRQQDLLLSGFTIMLVFLFTKLVLLQDDSHGLVFMTLGMILALNSQLPENRATC